MRTHFVPVGFGSVEPGIPLIVLLACMAISGCDRNEAPVGSASERRASAPQTTSQAAASIAGDAHRARLEADVDCDGAEDAARMEYVGGRVRVTVTLAASQACQSLEFGIGDSIAQGSLCGTRRRWRSKTRTTT